MEVDITVSDAGIVVNNFVLQELYLPFDGEAQKLFLCSDTCGPDCCRPTCIICPLVQHNINCPTWNIAWIFLIWLFFIIFLFLWQFFLIFFCRKSSGSLSSFSPAWKGAEITSCNQSASTNLLEKIVRKWVSRGTLGLEIDRSDNTHNTMLSSFRPFFWSEYHLRYL